MSQPYSKREGSRGMSGVTRDGRIKKDERTGSSVWSRLNLVGEAGESERERETLSATEEGGRGG